MVALVAIQDKKTMHALLLAFSILVEVPKPFSSQFIGNPTVVADGDSPIHWHGAVFVPR